MKRIISLVLVVLICFSTFSCGNAAIGNTNNTSSFISEVNIRGLDSGDYTAVKASYENDKITYEYKISAKASNYSKYEYVFSEGRLSKVILTTHKQGKEVITNHEITYDEANGVVEEKKYTDNKLVATTKTVYTFDSENRIKSKKITSEEEGIKLAADYYFSYDNDTYKVTYDDVWTEADGKLIYTVKNVATLPYDGSSMTLRSEMFDENGNPGYSTESYVDSQSGLEKTGKILSSVSYYNALGYITKTERVYDTGNAVYPFGVYNSNVSFNDRGQVINYEVTDDKGSAKKAEYTFDKKGNISSYKCSVSDNVKYEADFKWMQVPSDYVKKIQYYTGEAVYGLSFVASYDCLKSTDIFKFTTYKKDMIF